MVEQDLCIDERFILRELTPDELEQLRKNIAAEGRVRDAIIYWHDGSRNVIIDGINRWRLVKGTTIPYRTEPMMFKCFEQAKLWALNNQLGRRNCDGPELRNMRGEMYQLEKGLGEAAAKKVAGTTGVSERTIRRDGARVEKLRSLTHAAQKIATDATDREIGALASMSEGDQNIVARQVRTGQTTLGEAIKDRPTQKKEAPPLLKKYERAHWLKQWHTQIGHTVRLVDKIAEAVGEARSASHVEVQRILELATKEMMAWMGQ